jgi:hypothetical protein
LALSHIDASPVKFRQVTGYRLIRVADSSAIGKIGVCGIAGDRTVRLLMAIKSWQMRRATRAHRPLSIYGYLHKIGTRRFVIKRPTRSKSLSAFGNNFVEKSPKMRTTVRAAIRRRICMRIDYAGERVRRSCRTETQPREHRKTPTGLSTPRRHQDSGNTAIHEF